MARDGKPQPRTSSLRCSARAHGQRPKARSPVGPVAQRPPAWLSRQGPPEQPRDATCVKVAARPLALDLHARGFRLSCIRQTSPPNHKQTVRVSLHGGRKKSKPVPGGDIRQVKTICDGRPSTPPTVTHVDDALHHPLVPTPKAGHGYVQRRWHRTDRPQHTQIFTRAQNTKASSP